MVENNTSNKLSSHMIQCPSWDSNPDHSGEWPALSPLGQPCHPQDSRFKRLNSDKSDNEVHDQLEEESRSLVNEYSVKPKKVAKTLIYPSPVTCTTSSNFDTVTPLTSKGKLPGNDHSSGTVFAQSQSSRQVSLLPQHHRWQEKVHQK